MTSALPLPLQTMTRRDKTVVGGFGQLFSLPCTITTTTFLPRLHETKPPTQPLQIHSSLSSHFWECADVISFAISLPLRNFDDP